VDYRKRLRKKYLLGLLTSPLTLLPALGGATCLAAGAVGVGTPVSLLAGGAGILFGAGVFLQRLALGSHRLLDRAKEEVEREAREDQRRSQRAREAYLDDLDRRLTGDHDPRTETALRDLRALHAAFSRGEFLQDNRSLLATFDLLRLVEGLFRQCVDSLEETLRLHQASGRASSGKVRNSILGRRDAIIASVQQSVDALNQTLGELQGLAASGNNQEARLAQRRQVLRQRLDAAKRVERRIRSVGIAGPAETGDEP
jgi:hypothetical protein